MNNSEYVHLHVHTEYSTLDGFGSLESYANKANKLGFKYLACTDHGNIDGLIKFQQACENNNIKPILGCEIYIVPEISKERKNGHALLLVKNNLGFKNICKLLSFANTDGFYYKPRVTSQMLLDHCKGLVISTACVQSFVTQNKDGIELAEKLIDKIGSDFYFELMPNKMKLQKKHNRKIIKLANKFGSKIIVTNDCHYIDKMDWKAQEVLLAIQRKAKWTDENRFKFSIHGLHLKSANQMIAGMKKIGMFKYQWMKNTIEVAEKCSDFRIKKRDIRLPKIEGISKKDEARYLKKLCFKNFKKIFYDGKILYHKNPYIRNWPIYYKRFKEEYNLIKSKNFIRYFLIVENLVNWCRRNDILIGPGRGSVGGSLIAYLLHITDVDPIKHKLLFSRFINEDRIDYPDIDIDFEARKIHLVRQYLEDTYGYDNVVGVSSFNRLKSRAVIQDVARVFSIPNDEVSRFTKLIDQVSEDGINEAIAEFDEAKEFADKHPEVMKIAEKLEGQIKTRSQHAAALVISNRPLSKSNRGNLIQLKDATVINWEKEDAEYMGLMKLDALSLKLLDIISETFNLIKKNHNIEIVDVKTFLSRIPLDDKKVLKDISDGNTIGLFQINTWATKKLIEEMGVEKFDHIVAIAALVRPGPTNSGMTAQYIKRKHGEPWIKKHEIYEKITKDTYGLLVYQEQIMEVINKVAGLPYSTADKIRKIIGKKRDVKEFKTFRRKFINGCKKQKIFSTSEAKEFWEGLLEWARYGFNLSHSVEYGMIGYWCGWIKHYYPTEFISASLTYGAKDKKHELVEEAYRLGLKLVLPRVNSMTDAEKWIASDGKIYVPFIEVKGIGSVKAKEAVQVKTNGPSLFDTSSDDAQIYHEGALGKLLDDIDAYRKTDDLVNPSEDIHKYFDFRIVSNPTIEYENLYKLFDYKLKLANLDNALQGKYSLLSKLSEQKKIVRKVKFRNYRSYCKKLSQCNDCSLINECTAPVPPSMGVYNISIYGQDPGFEEDKKGEGFIGKAGQKLWDTINKNGYKREQFFVSNINKCFPSKSGKSSDSQILACSKWADKELKMVKPIVILAFGNSCLKFFKNQKGGITELSGKTEWIEKYKCWVCWCIHPSAVLRNSSNKVYYKSGMTNFFKTLNAINFKKSV
jgi:DNA polymerase-3 subunit alpha